MSVRPDWLKVGRVVDIYSVSNCISEDFGDYIRFWKHNGYWFFDSAQAIVQLAAQDRINLTGMKLFFYEVHELEFDDTKGQWSNSIYISLVQ